MDGLDFWVGDWDAEWDGGRGRNTVTREVGDRVYVERFRAEGDDSFEGMSLSLRNSAGEWRQSWADSDGNHWAFVGGPQRDGTFVFRTPVPVDSEGVFKRMVFSEITADSFAWRWEFSVDGQRWDQRWAIRYRRRR